MEQMTGLSVSSREIPLQSQIPHALPYMITYTVYASVCLVPRWNRSGAK